jgi:hypothetical protein
VLETCERRDLMTVLPIPAGDMTTMALLSPVATRPTHLYLNFDGGTVSLDPVHDPSRTKGARTIDAFDAERGDATHKRDQDIQEILFEVSEVFAPFDVQVSRISGAGNYARSGDGSTTIFVGGDTTNTTSTSKFTASFTPAASSDYPSASSPSTSPDSHPYDIAFMDPVSGTNDRSTWSTENGLAGMFDITRSIAHEAGHTFGLAHVRSDGSRDPATLGTGSVSDVMSYDARNQYFANQTLNITDWNYEPNAPKSTPGLVNGFKIEPGQQPTNDWSITVGSKTVLVPVPVSVQNSYTYLSVELGPRPSEPHAHVADLSRVDPTYRDGPRTALAVNSKVTGELVGKGDYHVYTLNLAANQSVTIDVQAVWLRAIIPGQSPPLSPDVFVYDSSGRVLLDYGLNSSHAAVGAVQGGSGGTFVVVVGSVDGNTSGGYQIRVKPSLIAIGAPGVVSPGLTTGQSTPQGPVIALPPELVGVAAPADGPGLAPSGPSHPAGRSRTSSAIG